MQTGHSFRPHEDHQGGLAPPLWVASRGDAMRARKQLITWSAASIAVGLGIHIVTVHVLGHSPGRTIVTDIVQGIIAGGVLAYLTASLATNAELRAVQTTVNGWSRTTGSGGGSGAARVARARQCAARRARTLVAQPSRNAKATALHERRANHDSPPGSRARILRETALVQAHGRGQTCSRAGLVRTALGACGQISRGFVVDRSHAKQDTLIEERGLVWPTNPEFWPR